MRFKASILSAGLLFVLGTLLGHSVAEARVNIDEAVRAAYPQAIAKWASGEAEEAKAMVEEMETSLLRPRSRERDLEAVWRSKLGVIRDLIANSSNEVLTSVICLHHDMYLHYRKRRPLLANHSVQMSLELSEYYVDNSADPGASLFAADVMASLGGYLQEGFLMSRAAELFARADRVFPAGLAAPLGLGAMYERRGEIDQALEFYARGARNGPSDPEAQLRYGVASSRVGNVTAAESALAKVLELDPEDWMKRFAMEELVRLAATDDARRDRAAKLREAFPDSSRVAIQLALLAEKRRETSRALNLLQSFPAEAEAESERYRYTRWPRSAVDRGRTRMQQAARGSNSTLVLVAANFAP